MLQVFSFLTDTCGNNYRRYSTISQGFFQKNLTDKMNSTYRQVNKKKYKKTSFLQNLVNFLPRLILEVDL